MPKFAKVTLVILGAVGLSTLGIQASDFVRGISSTALTITGVGPCGSGATLFQLGASSLCVDTYEAAPSKECALQEVQRAEDTAENLSNPECAAVSQEDILPWRFISLSEAQQLCARSGKRLLTSEEWFKLALTTTDVHACNTATGAAMDTAACSNQAGVANLVGNVWEWVDETVVNGQFEGRQLPQGGYVTLADSNGVVVETAGNPSETFGSDYAWTTDRGTSGMIRGGFFDSGDDAGLYAQNLAVPLDLRVNGVGFRCVQDVSY